MRGPWNYCRSLNPMPKPDFNVQCTWCRGNGCVYCAAKRDEAVHAIKALSDRLRSGRYPILQLAPTPSGGSPLSRSGRI